MGRRHASSSVDDMFEKLFCFILVYSLPTDFFSLQFATYYNKFAMMITNVGDFGPLLAAKCHRILVWDICGWPIWSAKPVNNNNNKNIVCQGSIAMIYIHIVQYCFAYICVIVVLLYQLIT